MRRIDMVNVLLLMNLLAIAILSLWQSVSLQHTIVGKGVLLLLISVAVALDVVDWMSEYVHSRSLRLATRQHYLIVVLIVLWLLAAISFSYDCL